MQSGLRDLFALEFLGPRQEAPGSWTLRHKVVAHFAFPSCTSFLSVETKAGLIGQLVVKQAGLWFGELTHGADNERELNWPLTARAAARLGAEVGADGRIAVSAACILVLQLVDAVVEAINLPRELVHMQAVAWAGTLDAAAQMALPRILVGGITEVTGGVLLSCRSRRRSNRRLRRARTGLQVSELLLHDVEAAAVDAHMEAVASGGLCGQLGIKVQLHRPHAVEVSRQFVELSPVGLWSTRGAGRTAAVG